MYEKSGNSMHSRIQWEFPSYIVLIESFFWTWCWNHDPGVGAEHLQGWENISAICRAGYRNVSVGFLWLSGVERHLQVL